MANVTFILPDGSARACNATLGLSLMEVALQNSVTGIVAECNGAAACATCHVIIDEELAGRLDPASDHENDMLDFTTAAREPGSRLGCQIKVDARLAGAIVRVPRGV
ncbi:2Fe-2S iron-sulfur cluster-binding protein [Rhizobium phaseoli]|uniref:2Fe-2S ferredoxin-like protein n=1 Tax=Rhizobium phaseoli TaxID=396 RepID=A0ABM6CKU0_9HYPH|nr:2Fe-2S iron-sulfur cluster-binding protein [Rhizobium phaseoli]EGE55733.1 ferredoxin VI [Rhizobium etli CNPAF512]KEC70017.1 2Fe-2S ferredoxin [Rhizobium leguminosarum bv. phaseoli CCGM1]ANL50926.1 2Fe-2S ferredoxin-like protein [Rhizobium phaseoli]ANL88986.1 2Fe-2S ferredoxin-like protein [Rhizobium phaseoli]ANL95495.1 2Fe-2S ferredoxin-like protein [Rhizobium phaseoli]